MRGIVKFFVLMFVVTGCSAGSYRFYQAPDNPEQIPTGEYFVDWFPGISVEVANMPTAEPSQSPGPEATPTPETDITPNPTRPAFCTLRTNTVIRVRSGPGVEYSIIGRVELFSLIEVRSFAETDRFLWAERSAGGWVAIYDRLTLNGEWWIDTGIEAKTCETLPGWPTDLTLPVSFSSEGWVTRLNSPTNELIEAGNILQSAGIQPAIVLTDNTAEACEWVARGWRVLIRPWYLRGLTDDPRLYLNPKDAARIRIDEIAPAVPQACAEQLIIQLTNETTFNSAVYMRDFALEAGRACSDRGWSCMPVVWSTGTPPLDWVQTYLPAVVELQRANHWIGYNAYPAEPGAALSDPRYLFTTYRLELMYPGGLANCWITEAGAGVGNEPPNLTDILQFSERADRNRWAVRTYWHTGGPSVWDRARWSGADILEYAKAKARALAGQ